MNEKKKYSRRRSEFKLVFDSNDQEYEQDLIHDTHDGIDQKLDNILKRHNFARAASSKSSTSKDLTLQNNPYTDIHNFQLETVVLSPSEDLDPMLSKVLLKDKSSSYFNRPITNDYDVDVESFLGQGAFATVKKGINKKNGKVYAVKIIDKKILMTENEVAALYRELSIHSKLKHKNITTLNAVYEYENKIYLVLPYADQSLDTYIYGKLHLEEREAKWIMYQVLSALDYLHKNNIGHGDIKPSNVLLFKNENYKPNQDPCMKWTSCLCDFGLSILNINMTHPTRALQATSVYGSSGFTSPEMLSSYIVTRKGDIWAAGIILYILLVGYTPFYPCYKPGDEVDFDPRDSDHLTEDAKNMVRLMLTVDRKQRPTCEELLRKKWFRECVRMELSH